MQILLNTTSVGRKKKYKKKKKKREILASETFGAYRGRRRKNTNDICDGAAICKPSIGQSIAEVDSVPWKSRPGKAPGETDVVANV